MCRKLAQPQMLPFPGKLLCFSVNYTSDLGVNQKKEAGLLTAKRHADKEETGLMSPLPPRGPDVPQALSKSTCVNLFSIAITLVTFKFRSGPRK